MSTLFVTLADGTSVRVRGVDLGGGEAAVATSGAGSAAASTAQSVVSASSTTPATFTVSAVLPAAGVWTSTAAHAIAAGAKTVSFLVSYTGAAAGCAVKYRFRKGFSSNLAAMGSEQVTTGVVTPGVAAPTASIDVYDMESKRPVTGTAATVFTCDFSVEGGWTHCTLELAEYGNTAFPGTASSTVAESF